VASRSSGPWKLEPGARAAEFNAAPFGILGLETTLSLFHLDDEITILASQFRSKSRNTPFDGWTLKGRPVTTIVGGREVVLP
jgi:dihydroorotase-like cyclic amidohydrolase